MMLSKSLISFSIVLGAFAVSAKSLSKRATTFNLYAYGTNVGIGGLPLYYSDGYAYIGSQLGNASTTANVTFSLSSTSVVITGSNSTSVSGKSLVIDSSSNGDISFASSPLSSQTSTGFTFFGSLLFWKSTAGQLQSSFYAAPTGTDGIWKVQWLLDPSSAGSSVSIALKKDGPGSLAITK